MKNEFFKFSSRRILFSTVMASALLAGSPQTVFAEVNGVQTVMQTGTVKGQVVDATGEPVIGATVQVKGTTNGTITDFDGNFTLNNVPEKGILVISYIGYKTQEVNISGKTNVKVVLKEDTEVLDEVVVVGYGAQKKASLTSSISQIKGDEAFKNKGIANATVALQGEVPGLTITRTSTRPGSEGAEMKIRGDISVNGKSSPLVIIDGITGSLDELNAMDASDIENISVLKDASAAIYGARSASGVVLVTTKRGKKGKAQISYSGSVSRTINGIQPPITNNREWLDMFYEAQYNDAAALNPSLTTADEIHKAVNWWIFNSFGGPTLDQSDIDPATGAPTVYKGETLFNALRAGKVLTLQNGDKVERWDPNVYMMDYLYGQATSQKHSISISGADEKFSYRASLGYADNNSQLKVANDGEKKYSGRLNADYQATDALKFETSMSYDKRDIITPTTDVGAGYFDPWFWTVYNKNGQAYDTFSGNRNPIGGLTQGGEKKNSLTTFRGSAKATYDFSKWVKGLSISASGAYKTVQRNMQEVKNKVQYYDWVGTQTGNKQGPGQLKEEIAKWENITLGAFANYNRTFADVHSVSAMLGMTAEQETYKRVGAVRKSGAVYPGSGLADLDVWVNGNNNEAYGGQNSWGLVSYLGRLNYTYDDKYLLTATFRRDASSRVKKENRWGNFPSISAAWRISKERFFAPVKWVDDLKVRASYGTLGSLNIGYWDYAPVINTFLTATFGTEQLQQNAAIQTNLVNENLKWESQTQLDFGFDATAFNNRLTFSADYYISKTKDVLTAMPILMTTGNGAGNPVVNAASLENRGFEFSFGWREKRKDFSYYANLNFSTVKNKVTSLGYGRVDIISGQGRTAVGRPIGEFYLIKTDGIFQNDGEIQSYKNSEGKVIQPDAKPGDIKYIDFNDDGKITDADRQVLGSPHSLFQAGINMGFAWKNFDLKMNWFMDIGSDVFNATKQYMIGADAAGNGDSNYLKNFNYWTPERPTNIPRPIAGKITNRRDSDYWLENGSWVKLKTLSIGYTIPEKLLHKIHFNTCRVYVTCQNLLTISSFSMQDPEYRKDNIWNKGYRGVAAYPNPFAINFGVQFQF